MKKHLTLTTKYLLIFIIFLPYLITHSQSPCTLSDGAQAVVVNIDNDEVIVQMSINGNKLFQRGREVSTTDEYDCSKSLKGNIGATTIKTIKSLNAEVWQVSFPINIDGTILNDVIELVDYLNGLNCVEYAQPNFLYHLDALPNDPNFNMQTHLQDGALGNINMTDAWDITTGDVNRVVGILDSGIDTDHIDLANNIWINTDEIPNDSLDNDGNGYTDDYLGWNFVDNTNIVEDSLRHGTFVAGIIGAVGNNGIGITGINWNIKMMALKCFDDNGTGKTADIINALAYSIDKEVELTNNSWGGIECDSLLKSQITLAQDSGQLFVCSAGNQGNNVMLPGGPISTVQNNDIDDYFPANFTLNNIFSVMSSNDGDFGVSNYGATSVDIAAPGDNIFTTSINDSLAVVSGTSMATAQVTGIAALLWSAEPNLTHLEVKDKIICRADAVDNLDGKCVANGRLDAANLLNLTSQIALDMSMNDCTDASFTVDMPINDNDVDYLWTFEDGSQSTQDSPIKVLNNPDGSYNICLQITDDCNTSEYFCETISADLEVIGTQTYSTTFFNRLVCDIEFCGNPPYNYFWDTDGYVSHAVLSLGHVKVQYYDTSQWSVTIQDHDGDQQTFSYNQNAKTLESSDTNKNLRQVYPNPFKDNVTIDYHIQNEGSVYITLFDAQGKMVEQILDAQNQQMGNYQYTFNTQHLSKGVYFVQLNTPDGQFNEKIIRF